MSRTNPARPVSCLGFTTSAGISPLSKGTGGARGELPELRRDGALELADGEVKVQRAVAEIVAALPKPLMASSRGKFPQASPVPGGCFDLAKWQRRSGKRWGLTGRRACGAAAAARGQVRGYSRRGQLRQRQRSYGTHWRAQWRPRARVVAASRTSDGGRATSGRRLRVRGRSSTRKVN